MTDIGIYIHIPFCIKKCYYCDFISFADKQELIDSYIEALIEEIKNTKLENYIIKTIYIGGGTPSILDSKNIAKILENIKFDKDVEITIEVNPGAVTKEKLENYVSLGINRISIGLQTANNNLLKEIGRIHRFEDFMQTYEEAYKTGFRNINVDLMLGLPNQTLEDLEDSLIKVIKLKPNHISTYSLILEPGTKLEEDINANKLNMIDEETEREMYWMAKEILEENGYIHYEISNFAKKRL